MLLLLQPSTGSFEKMSLLAKKPSTYDELAGGVSSLTARVKNATTWPLWSSSVGGPKLALSTGQAMVSNSSAMLSYCAVVKPPAGLAVSPTMIRCWLTVRTTPRRTLGEPEHDELVFRSIESPTVGTTPCVMIELKLP